MLDTDHEDYVTHCEALAEAAQPKTLLRRYMYLALVEVWVRPELKGQEFDSGFIVAHGYIWDSNEDKVACTALVTASNSDAIRGFDLNAGSLNRDLRLQFEKKLADTLREAAPPKSR
jgi:hypothetical protein